jgi:hypothetical protein
MKNECYICGEKGGLHYTYGNFTAIGVRLNVGWLLCPDCRDLLLSHPNVFRKELEAKEAKRGKRGKRRDDVELSES